MKYMLMINVPYATGEYDRWAVPEDGNAHLDDPGRMNRGLNRVQVMSGSPVDG